MGRGITGFDGAALRAARRKTPCPEDPRRPLTAARLAQIIGTSKAQVLNYENGHSSPSPRRLSQIAAVLGVPASHLCSADEASPTDLRVARGLTLQDAADQLGIAVNTYKRIETEGIFPRRRPAVLWQLAPLLRVEHSVLQAALNRVPRVQDRRRGIAVVLDHVVEQALGPGALPQLSDTSPEIQLIAILLKTRASAVSRLVNEELHELRGLAAKRAQAQARAEFAINARIERARINESRRVAREIADRKAHFPELLERYLLNPLPQSCWLTLVRLYKAGPAGVEAINLDRSGISLLSQVFDSYLLEMQLMGTSLSTAGAMFVEDVAPYYGAIYPLDRVRLNPYLHGWSHVVSQRRQLRQIHSLQLAHMLGRDPRAHLADRELIMGRVRRG